VDLYVLDNIAEGCGQTESTLLEMIRDCDDSHRSQ